MIVSALLLAIMYITVTAPLFPTNRLTSAWWISKGASSPSLMYFDGYIFCAPLHHPPRSSYFGNPGLSPQCTTTIPYYLRCASPSCGPTFALLVCPWCYSSTAVELSPLTSRQNWICTQGSPIHAAVSRLVFEIIPFPILCSNATPTLS